MSLALSEGNSCAFINFTVDACHGSESMAASKRLSSVVQRAGIRSHLHKRPVEHSRNGYFASGLISDFLSESSVKRLVSQPGRGV